MCCRKIDNNFIGVESHDLITNGLHEMSFPESDLSVDEQRIVGDTWLFSCLLCSTKGHLTAISCNEVVEGKLLIEDNSKLITERFFCCAVDRNFFIDLL